MHRQLRIRTRLQLETLEDRCTPAFGFQAGVVMAHAQVVPVFFGDYWSTSTGMQSAAQINTFLSSIVNSAFMDTMNQYGVGRGTLVGVGIIDPGLSGVSAISDSVVQAQLANDIATGRLPAASNNTLYIVFTPPNVTVSATVESTTYDALGYHNAFAYSVSSVVDYAVIKNPVGNGTVSSLSTFQSLTLTITRELANSVTDPQGTGWIDPTSGVEVASAVATSANYAFFNNYVVAGLWSQLQLSAAYPVGSTPPTFNVTTDQILGSNVLGSVAGSFTTTLEYYDRVVETYYENYLHRAAGQSELNFWALNLAAGGTNEYVQSMIVGSDEYFQKAGGTNEKWIDALYHDLLGRAPDKGGLALWEYSLSIGAKRQQVASLVDSSAEHEAIVVGGYYQAYLGRHGSSGEIAYWVSTIGAGATEEQVATQILASAEFLNRSDGTLSGWLTSVYEATLKRAPDTAGFNSWTRVLNAPFAS